MMFPWRVLVSFALLLVCSVARADLTVEITYAGADGVFAQVPAPLELRLGDPLTLQAAISDPAAPVGSTSTQTWSKVSGPGDVTFSAPSAKKTQVTVSAPGAYVLSLGATLGGSSSSTAIQLTAYRRPPAGTYRGLVYGPTGISGIVSSTVTSTGAFSATVRMGYVATRFTGALDSEGIWKGTVKLGFASVKTTLQTNAAGSGLNVTVARSSGANRAALAVTGVPKNGVSNAAHGGKHTFILVSQDVAAAEDPRGHGYGVLTIRRNGAITMVGKMPDGVAFSAGSKICPTGAFDVYQPLYVAGDFLGGTLRFGSSAAARTAISGSIAWKASVPLEQTAVLDFTGSTFVVQPSYLDPLTGSAQAVTAQFSSGGQGRTTASQSITLQVSGSSVMNSPAKLDLSMRIFRSGYFFGTFRIPGRVNKSSFAGVVLQDTGSGGGLLLGSTNLGWVELKEGGSTSGGGNQTP